MRLWLTLIALMLTGCGWFGPRHAPATPSATDRLGELRTSYGLHVAALAAASDKTSGWPSATDCDGTLWAGEAVSAGVTGVQLALAEQKPGEIHRRPLADEECYPPGAAATVSRDMIVGYAAGAYAERDGTALARLAAYGEAHAWVMGQGVLSDTLLTPDGAALVARAGKALGGPVKFYDAIPLACLPVDTDSSVHIQTLAIMLDGQIEGGISSKCLKWLTGAAAAAPADALLQAAAGTYTGSLGASVALLLDPDYMPPSYVRGAPAYPLVHWLYAAHLVLTAYGSGP